MADEAKKPLRCKYFKIGRVLPVVIDLIQGCPHLRGPTGVQGGRGYLSMIHSEHLM